MIHICGDGTVVVHPLFQGEDDGSIPISPLQLRVSTIDVDTAIDLNRLWHSRFPFISQPTIVRPGRAACFGATHANRYYAVAIWSRPNAANRMNVESLELRRLAIAPRAPKNTASRLLAIMARHLRVLYPDVRRLLSYQDTEVHTGTIYKAAGWSIGARTVYRDWTGHRDNAGYVMRPEQSTADKVRWQLEIAARESPQAVPAVAGELELGEADHVRR